MIIDKTGVLLTPGMRGKDCIGNGDHAYIECCCDECDYFLCCLDSHDPSECITCEDKRCPRSPNCTE